ncbi:PREDICTED: uncharacterized protein LOC104798708 isoform X1 [Tarenaya hassleriana]|uniref:uncharacterized protein LOC104798708 isoform X1 n=1 Tax=Tarenaya hassleriana TaxID=28532 RepID=UPI0008FCE1BD|nr:PREDICTED: uncharacterized protein LOC104798708 isoform X1 [Tarenaya hassleriana]XP_019056276.1 PREDICTED: uncharacterized protein LOC104798708 isoform X1 [Tarenaya hassleriana]
MFTLMPMAPKKDAPFERGKCTDVENLIRHYNATKTQTHIWVVFLTSRVLRGKLVLIFILVYDQKKQLDENTSCTNMFIVLDFTISLQVLYISKKKIEAKQTCTTSLIRTHGTKLPYQRIMNNSRSTIVFLLQTSKKDESFERGEIQEEQFNRLKERQYDTKHILQDQGMYNVSFVFNDADLDSFDVGKQVLRAKPSEEGGNDAFLGSIGMVMDKERNESICEAQLDGEQSDKESNNGAQMDGAQLEGAQLGKDTQPNQKMDNMLDEPKIGANRVPLHTIRVPLHSQRTLIPAQLKCLHMLDQKSKESRVSLWSKATHTHAQSESHHVMHELRYEITSLICLGLIKGIQHLYFDNLAYFLLKITIQGKFLHQQGNFNS